VTQTPSPPLTIFVAHPSELLTDHVPHGDGLVAFGFLRRLAERGHAVHVAAERVDVRGPLPARLHVYPLAPHRGLSWADRLIFMVRMRVLFERLRRRVSFDLVHQMNPVFTGLSLALLGVSTPIVLGTFVPEWDRAADETTERVRTEPLLRGMLRDGVARVQQSRAAGLLIATPQALTRIVRRDRHRDRIYEVPHGIDLERFIERGEIPARPSILFLAGVARRKGIFTLLEAFERVSALVRDALLVIAGSDGGDLPEVRQRVAAMPAARVQILGAVDRRQVPELMRSHSVYCLPSYGEPFATTILEAMACGVPIVATRAGGMPDLVSGEGGRLVPPRDVDALAAALLEVLGSRGVQRRMGRHNRMRVEAKFDAEKAVDRLEDAYRAILANETSKTAGRARSRLPSSPARRAISRAVDAPTAP
jgi:glycosyltransferase involved in cell wall biosynthesis